MVVANENTTRCKNSKNYLIEYLSLVWLDNDGIIKLWNIYDIYMLVVYVTAQKQNLPVGIRPYLDRNGIVSFIVVHLVFLVKISVRVLCKENR